MRETKPVLQPKEARLCATMAEELPSVNAMALASNSRSWGSSRGSPYRTRSRLSSPAMMMSKRGMLKSAFVVKHYHPAQMARRVGIEPLLQAGIKSQELRNKNVGCRLHQFWEVARNFYEQVGRRAGLRLGLWSDYDSGSAKTFDFFQ